METSRSKHFSTLVGNCPSCTGYVRVPLDARPEASARCPHCGSTFSITDVLEQIPELEILEAPAKAVPLVDRQPIIREVPGERKKFAVPRQLISGAKKKRRHKGQNVPVKHVISGIAGEDESAFGGTSSLEVSNAGLMDPLSVTIQSDKTLGSENSSSARSISASNAARVRVHSSQRKRRMREDRKSNPAIEAMKIVMGGLLAFPIAYLILLWGIGQDPLNLAPSIANAIPFAVPKSFQKVAEQEKPKPRSSRAIRGGTEQPENSDSAAEEKLEVPKKLDFDVGINPTFIPGELERQLLSTPDVAPDTNSSSKKDSKKD